MPFIQDSKTHLQKSRLNWTVPTLINSWESFDGGAVYNTVGYLKDADGIVHLKGGIKTGTLDTVAFTLPIGYRPLKKHIFAVNSNGAYGSCYILADGTVIPHIGSNVSFFLDGINFLAEQ